MTAAQRRLIYRRPLVKVVKSSRLKTACFYCVHLRRSSIMSCVFAIIICIYVYIMRNLLFRFLITQ